MNKQDLTLINLDHLKKEDKKMYAILKAFKTQLKYMHYQMGLMNRRISNQNKQIEKLKTK